ncbi:MAG TPA: DUF3352 domain-containing protein [Frankiaceae bacterium]|nr:DUF3352 domain-containing protein [Frankiaceae bacterium]
MTDQPSTPPSGDPGDPTAAGAYDSTRGAGDPAGAGYPAAETMPEPKRGPGRGMVIGIGATVLAVVAGAAVYATTALSGGGRQPDELAPKSTFAYAKFDLDPAANQKLATREFLGKFPKLKKPANDENPFDSILEQLFEGEAISYDADVKPWFDKRAAIAGFRSTDGPTAVGILQSKDDGKARAAMDKAVAEAKKEDEDFAYKIDDGYVVVGDTQAHVDDAVAQAKKESIEKNATFSEDVDRLDGDQVAVAWVDLRAAFDVVKGELPDAGLIPNAVTDQIKGRVVSGLHMDGDFAEVTGYMIGMEQAGQKPPAANDPTLLKGLPAGTVAAVSMNGLADTLKQGLGQLSGMGLDPEQFVGPFLQEIGLSLDDVFPLLGDQTVVSLGEVPTGPEDVAAGLLSTVKDPATAKTNGTKLAAAVTQLGVPVQADVSGNTFYLATPDYLPALKAGDGGLGKSEKFTKAMGDTGSIAAAVYVDLEAIIPMLAPSDEEAANVKALKAVGFTGGYDKGTPFFRLRVVAL